MTWHKPDKDSVEAHWLRLAAQPDLSPDDYVRTIRVYDAPKGLNKRRLKRLSSSAAFRTESIKGATRCLWVLLWTAMTL